MSTHNLCFGAKIRKKVNPCKPQFYYIKVGCKGVFVTRTCFRDDTVMCFIIFYKMSPIMRKPTFACARVVTTQLISALVFATLIVQFLYFLKTKIVSSL